MAVRVLTGDCLALLPTLPADTFQACVTSPPYYGLRDYGVAGQIGLEETLDEYLARIVAVFREVRRVLRPDGTLWLNLGDSYAGSWGAEGRRETPAQPGWRNTVRNHPKVAGRLAATAGLKRKDAMLVPERTILALQADGWWVRDKIIWAKPNPMPSSVRDRFCPAWEPIYLLSKSARYFFDAVAAREPRVQDEDANGFRGGSYVGGVPGQRQERGNKRTDTGVGWGRLDATSPVVNTQGRGRIKRTKVPGGWMVGPGTHGSVHPEGRTSAAYQSDPVDSDGKRLMRNVWSIATEPFKEAHFATFPTALAERCIAIGTRRGDEVLDPFGGAGTTGLVADRLGRHATLIELNHEYATLARERVRGDAPLLAETA